MENKRFTNPQDIQIQGLLDRYVRSAASNKNASPGNHLDEDLLAAFTEGNLNAREAQPIVNHLIDCSFCRHVTAELVRLDFAFSDQDIPTAAAVLNQPSKISEVLSSLLSRIFGTNDGAVFAHEEKNEDKDSIKETEKGSS